MVAWRGCGFGSRGPETGGTGLLVRCVAGDFMGARGVVFDLGFETPCSPATYEELAYPPPKWPDTGAPRYEVVMPGCQPTAQPRAGMHVVSPDRQTVSS